MVLGCPLEEKGKPSKSDDPDDLSSSGHTLTLEIKITGEKRELLHITDSCNPQSDPHETYRKSFIEELIAGVDVSEKWNYKLVNRDQTGNVEIITYQAMD
jgi:hypothetical protein